MERLYPEETQKIKDSAARLSGEQSFQDRVESTKHLMNGSAPQRLDRKSLRLREYF